MNAIEKVLDFFIKRGEHILHNNKLVKKTVDLAFNVIGDSTDVFYAVQDKLFATMRMVKAYASKEYTDIPPKTIVIALAGLMYIANPIDLIPSFIPVIGLLDDLSVAVYVLSLINSEVEKFIEWETKTKNS
jgi:uncharacterized membrane protein YkvA (DUF1232 family)